MIVTDKFVFVHLPRSGGTFIAELIRKFFSGVHEIGYHLPRTFLPREYSHLPVLGAVRNPWDFYVSWYHHVWPRDAATTLISWVTESGKLGFVDTIRNAVNLGVNNERLDVLIEMLPEHVDYGRKNIPNITKEAMRKVRGTGVGYYTFRFTHLFGNADDVFICRFETLTRDLIAFFESIGSATDELRDYVLNSDKKNTAEHLHYSAYYTPELTGLVLLRDRQLVQRFGYVFEQASSVADGGPTRSIREPTTSL
jgi:hypothetical protein